jgi:hypothetical protein
VAGYPGAWDDEDQQFDDEFEVVLRAAAR